MYFFHVQKKSCPVLQKYKQVCVKIAQCKEREVMGTWYFFFMCLIDMNKFFDELWNMYSLLFMLYVYYGLTTNNKHILHKASIFVHAHVD